MRYKPLWPWVLLLLLLPFYALAATASEECIGCHSEADKYDHRGVSCVSCHADAKDLPHPEKLARPACTSCHKEIVGRHGRSIHNSKGIACKECHNIHRLQKERKACVSCHRDVSHQALPAREAHLGSLSCTACHGKPTKGNLAVGISVRSSKPLRKEDVDVDHDGIIDNVEWHSLDALLNRRFKGKFKIEKTFRTDSDPHTVAPKAVACGECHAAKGRFASAGLRVAGAASYALAVDSTIFVPELPWKDRYRETAHGKAGVKCSDCHLPGGSMDQKGCISCTICVKCHRNVLNVYKESVHGKKGATHCTDCHNPHYNKPYKELTAKQRVAVCARCHKDYIARHDWLPNTALHFDYLECTTCHSPQSEKSTVFYFAKRQGTRKTPLAWSEFSTLYGKGIDGAERLAADERLFSGDAGITRLFADLRKQEKDLLIDASIIVTKVHHDYSVTRLKERECVTCHSRSARFYSSVFFLLPGRTSQIYVPVKGTLLSAHPIATFVDICLLGEDKITGQDVRMLFSGGRPGGVGPTGGLGFKWIDLAGIALTLVVLFFILIHLILRLLVKR